MNNLPGFDNEAIVRLEAIFAAAASPAERRARGWLEPAFSENDLAARHSEWVRFVADGDEEAFSRLLEAQELTSGDFLAGLTDVRIANRELAPDWVRGILELSSAFLADGPAIPPFRVGDIAGATPLPKHISRDAKWRFHGAFEPFLRLAETRLEQFLGDARLDVSDEARRDLLLQLARRWNGIANSVLTSPLSVDAVLTAIPQSVGPTTGESYLGNFPISLPNWLGLWSVFPVLARLMSVVWLNWWNASREMLERLATDLPTIDATLWPDFPPGRLTEFRGDSGDTHDRGRSVAILTFESGGKVVYKPKNLGIAAVYFELAEMLSAGTDFPLLPRRLILRGDYAWEEWIPAEECRDLTGIRQYYRRLGAHARLLQFIDAVDVHHENVIAAGPHPTLIDLETVFAPRPKHDPESSAARRIAIETLWGNPAANGIVSCKACLEPGQPGTELGAICPLGDGSGPFSPTTTAIPKLEGSLTNPLDFAGDMVLGYRTIGQRLRDLADHLANDEDGPLRAAEGCPVRFVNRESQVYARLLSASLTPECLKNGIVRELVLEGLWKGWFEHSIPAGMVRHEIDDLRDLDISLFSSRPGASDLHFGNHVIENYFGVPAIVRAVNRLEDLKTIPVETETDFIRTALFIRSPDEPLRTPQHSPVIRVPRKPPGSQLLKAAVGIGDTILELEIKPEGDSAVWIGLDYQPAFNVWQLGLLESGLLSGTGGLAVVFAALWQKTGLTRFRDAARRILDSMTARLTDHAGSHLLFEHCGAFTGIGGMLHAIQHTSRMLGVPNPFWNRKRLSALRIRTQCRRAAPDFHGGLAGLLTGLLAMREESPAANTLISLIATDLDKGIRRDDWENHLPLVADAPHFNGFPDARQGVTLTLARVAAALDRPEFKPSREKLATDLFGLPEKTSLPEPGFLIGALEGAFLEPGFMEPILEMTNRYLGLMRSTTAENLIAGDVALTAYRLTGRDYYFEVARRESGLIYENFRQTGTWFPDSLAADRFNLSALVGLGAVAYLFLRIQPSHELPTLRTLGDAPRPRD